jgi:hypothetical protein
MTAQNTRERAGWEDLNVMRGRVKSLVLAVLRLKILDPAFTSMLRHGQFNACLGELTGLRQSEKGRTLNMPSPQELGTREICFDVICCTIGREAENKTSGTC